ncbi:hypothetical protein [Amycolatopsis viridis]|uniref:Uncharacterized protein n=1 Tax=Amycolatopsis viridis TaxID=185678 RepID=A0ABX0T073_9PSEU|nr:hypothetical protein [Amycolatopsis viridis]NIH81299.1 hypothetical protein [Amycolatopsis viridis]
MDNASRLADVMRRPGMYGIATLEQAIMFVGGFDAATEFTFLEGFGNWLAAKGAGGENQTWMSLVVRIIDRRTVESERRDLDDERILDMFFGIVRDYLDERRKMWEDPAPGRLLPRFESRES